MSAFRLRLIAVHLPDTVIILIKYQHIRVHELVRFPITDRDPELSAVRDHFGFCMALIL